jgi:hypothetical protein
MSRASIPDMAPSRVPETDEQSRAQKRAPRCDTDVPPTGQSPDDPIEFEADNEVACGNEERANAEPEPAALHAAEVPGKSDPAKERREIEKTASRESK